MTLASHTFSTSASPSNEKLCLVKIVKWQPANGETIEEGLCRTFGLTAADMVIDEFEGIMPHRRYDDSRFCPENEREKFGFFAIETRGRELVAQNPSHMRGPFAPIVAFTG